MAVEGGIPTLATPPSNPPPASHAHHPGSPDITATVRIALESLSLGLLVLAAFIWGAIWCRSPPATHPYRYVTLLVILACGIVSHAVGLVTQTAWREPVGVACRSAVAVNSYVDLTQYAFLLLHVLFCIAVAMRRLSAGPRLYVIVVVCLAIPLAVVGLETTLDLVFHPATPCQYFRLSSAYLWFTRAPKALLLLGTLSVLGVLFYWLFCFDNAVFKRNRDFLVIRHASVNLLLLVCLCLFSEIYELSYVSLRAARVSGRGTNPSHDDLMAAVLASRGVFVALLLCLLDLEVLSTIPGLACCLPDLQDTDVDVSWESRLRHESRVRFANDYDQEPAAASEDAGSGLRPRGKVTYGALLEEAEEESS